MKILCTHVTQFHSYQQGDRRLSRGTRGGEKEDQISTDIAQQVIPRGIHSR